MRRIVKKVSKQVFLFTGDPGRLVTSPSPTLLNRWDQEANCLISNEDSSSLVSSSSSDAKWWYRSERAEKTGEQPHSQYYDTRLKSGSTVAQFYEKASSNLRKIWDFFLCNSKLEPTVKVAGVIVCLQLGDEFSFLPQKAIPVKTQEEGVVFDLRGSAYNIQSFPG